MHRPLILNPLLHFQFELNQNLIIARSLMNAKSKTSTRCSLDPPRIRQEILASKDRIRVYNLLKIARENMQFYGRLCRSRTGTKRNKQVSSPCSLRKSQNIIKPKKLKKINGNPAPKCDDNKEKLNDKKYNQIIINDIGECQVEVVVKKYR